MVPTKSCHRQNSTSECNRLLLVILHTVLTTESLNPTSRIDQLLLAREERVAVGAYFHLDGLVRGAGRISGATGTSNLKIVVLRMYTGFHIIFLSFTSRCRSGRKLHLRLYRQTQN